MSNSSGFYDNLSVSDSDLTTTSNGARLKANSSEANIRKKDQENEENQQIALKLE